MTGNRTLGGVEVSHCNPLNWHAFSWRWGVSLRRALRLHSVSLRSWRSTIGWGRTVTRWWRGVAWRRATVSWWWTTWNLLVLIRITTAHWRNGSLVVYNHNLVVVIVIVVLLSSCLFNDNNISSSFATAIPDTPNPKD